VSGRDLGTAADGAIIGGMSELIFLVEEAPEGGFTARALGESIFTEADTLPELRAQLRDAVQCHFDEGQGPEGCFLLELTREELVYRPLKKDWFVAG
jgi:hypothetical protein